MVLFLVHDSEFVDHTQSLCCDPQPTRVNRTCSQLLIMDNQHEPGFGDFPDGQFDEGLPASNLPPQHFAPMNEMSLQNATFSITSGYPHLPSFPPPVYELNVQSSVQAQPSVLATDLLFQPQPPIDKDGSRSNSHVYAHMPPPPMNTDPTLRPHGRRRISTEEWLTQRDNIKRFYIDMGLTLPETMKAMESSYGFSASLVSYASRGVFRALLTRTFVGRRHTRRG
jgi:hypothetical protein